MARFNGSIPARLTMAVHGNYYIMRSAELLEKVYKVVFHLNLLVVVQINHDLRSIVVQMKLYPQCADILRHY